MLKMEAKKNITIFYLSCTIYNKSKSTVSSKQIDLELDCLQQKSVDLQNEMICMMQYNLKKVSTKALSSAETLNRDDYCARPKPDEDDETYIIYMQNGPIWLWKLIFKVLL